MIVDVEKGDKTTDVVIDVVEKIGDKSAMGDVPKCLPQYPQSLVKKKEDNQFKMFVDLFSKLSVDIPLVDAPLQKP